MICKISPGPSLPVHDRKRITKEGERRVQKRGQATFSIAYKGSKLRMDQDEGFRLNCLFNSSILYSEFQEKGTLVQMQLNNPREKW